MKKNILTRTNFFVCLILIIGFSLTAAVSYKANYSASLTNIEQITDLTSEGIFYQISDTFTKPVNVSLTMAHDSLLHEFLGNEQAHLSDKAYTGKLQEYLNTYRREYGYDSVFLVSAATERYYNFNGVDRVLFPDNPENTWYYNLMEGEDRYSINVDNDEVQGADDHITVFVNCKIAGSNGNILGIVGVGLRIDNLQELLRSYESRFGVSAYLINQTGIIQISTEYTGYEQASLFTQYDFAANLQEEILKWKTSGAARSLWSGNQEKNSYVVIRYIPELEWDLVVERNTGALVAEMNRQLLITIGILALLILSVLFLISSVLHRYNKKVVALTQAIEQERHAVFEKVTGLLFENIYEIDVTHNCSANQATNEYFESLGASAGDSFDKVLRLIAEKQIKPEFRQGYLDTFTPEHVIRAFEMGQDHLQYELLTSTGSQDYYWIRIIARLVRWESDHSIHMLVYRQNIHAEKQREIKMQELVQTDEMTTLLTKTATQQHIDELLQHNPYASFAFFIFDIDHFKDANDRFGHSFGDSVIRAFAQKLQASFPDGIIIGRLGGDEFCVFLPIQTEQDAQAEAQSLCKLLSRDFVVENHHWHITTSIGVSVAPKDGTDFNTLYTKADIALYQVKKQGRNGYSLYDGQ